jgi:hypothetical protein
MSWINLSHESSSSRPAAPSAPRSHPCDRCTSEKESVLPQRVFSRAGPAAITPELAIDLVFGTLWYRLLATHRSLDDQLADDLVAVLTASGNLIARSN